MANEIIRLTHNGTTRTVIADASGHALIAVSSSGWPQGTERLTITAEDTGRGMQVSAPVDIDVTVGPPDPLWQDLFNRANGAVGNNWADTQPYAATQVILNNALNLSQTNGYYHVVYNLAGGVLPADVAYRATVPHSQLASNVFGMVTRYVPAEGTPGSGIQVFHVGSNPGLWYWSEGALDAIWDPTSQPTCKTFTVTGGFPASWSVDQTHTIEVRVQGTRISLWMDGQEYGYSTLASAGAAGGGVGFSGDATGGWSVLDVAVFPV